MDFIVVALFCCLVQGCVAGTRSVFCEKCQEPLSGAGLNITLNGRVVSSGEVVITDVGEGPDAALICRTNKSGCCNEYPSRQGEWILPNGTLIAHNTSSEDFYTSRGPQQVLLHRRNNAMQPLGEYCCIVDTSTTANATICINMSKQQCSGLNFPVECTIPGTTICMILCQQIQYS